MSTASLSDDEIEDRYFLLGQMEILSVLNDFIHHREPVTVHFNGGRDFLLTTLLEARPDGLIFDPSGDVKANKRLPESPQCVFVGRLHGIRVQFVTKQAHHIAWGDSDAFWVPVPTRVVRMQRRESYRILSPLVNPLKVKFYGQDGLLQGEWPAHNLSVSGLGLTMSRMPQLELNQSIARVQLILDKKRTIDCAAVVRHVTPLGDKKANTYYRVGISFANLPQPMGVAMQRYITLVEHERRKTAIGEL